MLRQSYFALGALLVLGCDAPPRAPETASVYTERTDTIAQTLAGIELQAKPLIPALRDQMRRLREQPSTQVRDNLTAYKHQLADVLNAMRADLERTGAGDVGAFRALGDSVADDLSGGTGHASGLGGDAIDSVALNRHLSRVEQLIRSYEETARQSANKPER